MSTFIAKNEFITICSCRAETTVQLQFITGLNERKWELISHWSSRILISKTPTQPLMHASVGGRRICIQSGFCCKTTTDDDDGGGDGEEREAEFIFSPLMVIRRRRRRRFKTKAEWKGRSDERSEVA